MCTTCEEMGAAAEREMIVVWLRANAEKLRASTRALPIGSGVFDVGNYVHHELMLIADLIEAGEHRKPGAT